MTISAKVNQVALMAIFTTADRDNVKAAIVEAAVSGFASVTVNGQTVQAKSLTELQRLLEVIQQDLASGQPHGGMRVTQFVPGGTG